MMDVWAKAISDINWASREDAVLFNKFFIDHLRVVIDYLTSDVVPDSKVR